MSSNNRAARKVLASVRGLQDHLEASEEPLFSIPGIWDGGRESRSTACDIVLTNRRIFGYYQVSFPRTRLFLEAMPLESITNIALRQKSFEPLFRELLVSDGRRKVYIRAPRSKIEALYAALHSATESYAPSSTLDDAAATTDTAAAAPTAAENDQPPAPIFGRQDIRRPFENSPLAITLLFAGGILLEIIGVLLWSVTQNTATGLPLCSAGFVAVLIATMVLRQRRTS